MAKRGKSKGLSTNDIYGGIFVTISLIGLLHEYTGFVGELLYKCSYWLFGKLYFLVFILLCLIALYMFYTRKMPKMNSVLIAGIACFLLGVFIIVGIPADKATGIAVIKDFWDHKAEVFSGLKESNGGLVGTVLYGLISSVVSYWGAIIIAAVFLFLAISIIVGFEKLANGTVATAVTIGSVFAVIGKTLVDIGKKIYSWVVVKDDVEKEKPVSDKDIDVMINSKNKDGQISFNFKDDLTSTIETPVQRKVPEKTIERPQREEVEISSFGKAQDASNYRLPNINQMLDNVAIGSSASNKNNAKQKAKQLIEILQQFQVPSTLEGIQIGPSVTRFEVRPESGIKVSRITSLAENIKMELAVTDVRIEAPIPGKSAVGIEIPNESRSSVQMKELLQNIPSQYENKPLLVALGKDLSGERVFAELDKMPHVLIAGSTGSGKSVCINSIITTLLLRTKPDEVKLLLIDPKMVEFTAYRDIPHLIGPVINDPVEASNGLKTIVSIMENRYKQFEKTACRNIKEYNKKAATGEFDKMSYIVVIIDELADLMLNKDTVREVSSNIQRITQLARASGIHLITATQRPSTDVITGTIKANIPSRIAFSVATAIDSRIILDETGAESLLGNGDMLYIPMGESSAKRVQGVYVSDDEIHRITEFCKEQQKPNYDDAFVVKELGPNEVMNMQSADPLYDDVKKFVITTRKASTSSIQRYFGFGYNRAARIIDFLEQEGVVGPANGSKPREVYAQIDSPTMDDEE